MKKITKIVLSMLLVLNSLFVITPTVVSAAEDNTTGVKIIEKNYDSSTNIMTVAVQMKLPEDSQGISAIQTYVSYDSSRLTLMHKSNDSEFKASGENTSAYNAVDLKLEATEAPYTLNDYHILEYGNRVLMKLTTSLASGAPAASQNNSDWQDVFVLRFKVSGDASTTLNSNSLRIADPVVDEAIIHEFQNGGTSTSWTAFYTTINGGKQHTYGKMKQNTADESTITNMTHAENATAVYTGSTNTPPLPEYTGTEAIAPVVSAKVGGRVTLISQTITGETVEYASARTNTVPTSGWQTSNVFESLSVGEYYFFARVKENLIHKAGEVRTSLSPVNVFPSLALSYTPLTSMLIDTEITEMNPVLSGGTGTGTYSIVTGTLPTGLSMDSLGVISGTPTVAGTAGMVTVRYVDSEGQQIDEEISFPIVSKMVNTVSFTSPSTTVVEGSTYSFNATATNGTPTLHYTGRNTTSYDSATAPTEVGNYSVTASVHESAKYDAGSTTHNFSIIGKEISKIEVSTTKNSYIEGQSLDLSTVDVKVTYNDSSTLTIKGDAAGVSVSGFDSSRIGTQTITVSYGTKQGTFVIEITEKQLTGISVSGTPTKTSYVAFETFSPMGIVVNANYDNGHSEAIGSYTVNYENATPSFVAGDTSVVVSYNGHTATISGLTVNKLAQPIALDSSKKITMNTGTVDLRNLVSNIQEVAAVSFTLNDDGSTGTTLNADGYTLQAGTSVGNVVIGVNAGTTTNYEAFNSTLTVEVVDKATTLVTINPVVTSKTYGDEPFVLNASASEPGTGVQSMEWSSSNTGVLSVDSVSGLVTVNGVGTATITARFSSDTHAGSATQTITVNQRQLYWQDAGSVKNKVYDGTTSATLLTAPTLSGILASDAANVVVDTSGASYNFSNKNVADGIGVVAIGFGIDGLASANYIAPTDNPNFNNANITKKPITVVAVDKNRIYQTGNPLLTFAAEPTDFAPGDDVSVISASLETTATLTSDVDTYPITGTATSANYEVTVTAGTLTINKAPKANELMSATGKQGEANTASLSAWESLDGVIFTYNSKLPNDETIVVGTPTLSGSVLNYTLEASAPLGDNKGSIIVDVESKNYETFQVTVNLNVTKQTPQSLVFDEVAVNKTMGVDSVFTNNLTGAHTKLTYSSNNEQVAIVSNTGEVTLKGPGTAVITVNAASQNIGGNEYLAAEASYKLTVNNGLLTLEDETTIFVGNLDSVINISVDSTALTRDASGNLSGVTGYTANNGIVGKVSADKVKVVLYKEYLAYLDTGIHTLTVQTDTTDSTSFELPAKTSNDLTITNEGDGISSKTVSHTVGDIVTVTAGNRSGYNFAGWTVSGVKLDNATANTVTFVMMDSDATLTSKWVKIESGGSDTTTKEPSKPSTQTTKTTYYDIEIVVEGMGTVSPDGGSDNIVRVKKGSDTTFEFTAESGYVISDVLVDGESVGTKDSYTFEEITKDVTLKVIFTEEKVVEDTDKGVDDSIVDDNTDQNDTTEETTEEVESDSSMPVIIMLLVVILGGAGLFVYFKRKNN